MKITPALAYEKLRQDAQSQNKIILHKDGKFYHVYEWSAWLLKTLVCTEELQRERGDAKMLQVNRFVTKSGEYVLAGFPLESVSKYIGAEFLGGFIKPYRIYISNESLNRMMVSVASMNMRNPNDVWASVNSFLGVLSHYSSFNIRSRMFFNSELLKLGTFNREMTQFTLRQ